jgi:hypothetical protein
MSIWRHITDIELQRLKEASRAVQNECNELTELDRVHQETTVKLYSAQGDSKRYEDLAVAHAVGQNVGDLPPIPPTESQLRVLLVGINRRRIEKQREIDASKNRYRALVTATLKACIARAADVYRGQVELLAETWSEINTALVSEDIPTLAWRQIFVPALDGMPNAGTSHGRPVLFEGSQPNVVAMDADLQKLLS